MDHPSKLDEILKRAGEMGRLIREKDWSRTELGPIDSWPQGLATTVSICLASRLPIEVWWGPELVVIYNDAYIPIAGAKHPDLLGRAGPDAFAEIRESIGPMFEQVVNGGDASWSEDRMLFLDRSGYREECYFTWSCSPVLSEHGGVAGVFSAVQETTTRILGERRLRTLRELGSEAANARSVEDTAAIAARVFERNSFDLPFTAIYLLDPTSRGRLVLAAASGLAAGGALLPRVVPIVAADAVSADLWPFARVLGGEVTRVDHLDLRPGALPCGPWSDLPRSAVCLPIVSSDRESPAGVLIVGLSARRAFDDDYRGFLDLASGQLSTAIRAAADHQDERKRAEALAQIDRARTTFFSDVSRELRTPLTLILGPIEDILASAEGGLAPRWRGELELVHRNTQRLLRLVNNLLDFSRIEAGRAEARFEPTDLARLTADLASAFRSAVERAGLAFTIEVDPLPEDVFVDPELWEKVLLNLLSNALELTRSGGITLRLQWTGAGALLRISDTGVGVPEAEIPRLFERFHRVQGTGRRTDEGAGIGLALVRELVRLHGGTISVESALGVGTTFTVFLHAGSAHLPAGHPGMKRIFADGHPAASVDLEEAKSWLPADPASGRPPAAPGEHDPLLDTTSTKGALVLLVDDDRDMRESVAGLLRRHWRVEVASDGLTALAKVHELRPSLVLSDVMMPGLDGFGLLKAIREDVTTETVPVILLSAKAGEEARLDGFGAGADDYLIKPFSARELIVRVQAVLDISRSRQAARREAEVQRARLHALFMQAPAAIAVFRGPELRYEIANESYRQLVGVHRSLLGRTVREALPDLEPRIHEILAGVLASGQRFSAVDFPYLLDWDSDGKPTTRYLNVIYEPLKGDAGQVEGIMSFAYEVTDQVKARREIEGLARAAEAANITKSQFLANMSHEIRTPLGVILGFADLALDPGQSPDDQRNYLLGIKRNGQQLLEILGDILDLSKIEANKLEIERVAFSLDELLDDVAGLLVLRAREKGIGLRLDKHASLPAFIRTDPTRLRQIFVNLIGNAIKFTERGGVTVACEALSPEPGGARQTLVFTVKDTGIGISPEQRAKLFQPFVQADSTMTRRFGGTGLGLLLSQQLARALDGDLELAQSDLGKGSSFRFTIVAEPVERRSTEGRDRPSTPAAVSVAPEARAPLEGLKILLVEDSEDNQTLVSRYLGGAGAAVELADNGLDAVEAALGGDHDVILMDIQMPILDGHEATARLRQAGYTRPIIALTAHAMRDERERALKGGFDDYLTKPLQRAALIKTLRALKK